MDFFIKLKYDLRQNINLKIENDSALFTMDGTLYLDEKVGSEKEIRFSNGRALFAGDPVFHSTTQRSIQTYLAERNVGKIIREVDGFYYLFLFNEDKSNLIISGSIFSILPVYYQSTGESVYVSSSLSILEERTRHLPHTQDKQYYLEKAIFNYALFNRTPLSEIKIIPSNSYLELSEKGISIKKHTFIHNYFVSRPSLWRESLNYLSDLFIENTKAFMPAENFVGTLTGGFDGRTIVSLALAGGKEFEIYSYGSKSDPDVTIPLKISAEIGKSYIPVILNQEYAEDHFLENAYQFLIKSYGAGNISRAHYHYALKTRLSKTNYLLTGNFGSEILRSMKIPGVVTSAPLFSIFEEDNLAAFKRRIKKLPALFRKCALQFLHVFRHPHI